MVRCIKDDFRDIILGAKMVSAWKSIPDNEIVGPNAFYANVETTTPEYERVTNNYYRMTCRDAKLKAARYGRKVQFYRQVDSEESMTVFNDRQDFKKIIKQVSTTLREEEKPGNPFKHSLLKDKFTIDTERVERFKGTHGHPIGFNEMLPILQQIMTNQKEIMDILNTRPEDKMVKEKFLEEFDKTMQEVLK